MPWLLSLLITSNSLLVSLPVIEAVGSSSKIIFALVTNALAISTSCICATDKFLTLSVRSISKPRVSSACFASRVRSLRSIIPNLSGGLCKVIFSSTENSGIKFRSW